MSARALRRIRARGQRALGWVRAAFPAPSLLPARRWSPSLGPKEELAGGRSRPMASGGGRPAGASWPTHCPAGHGPGACPGKRDPHEFEWRAAHAQGHRPPGAASASGRSRLPTAARWLRHRWRETTLLHVTCILGERVWMRSDPRVRPGLDLPAGAAEDAPAPAPRAGLREQRLTLGRRFAASVRLAEDGKQRWEAPRLGA